ncbi:MAG: bifunctional molybdopterin-guanine dinucleotide biosynthesis adaptor protein MobB/molybdopterin molybdotransferase MoeA [Alphaproteobacteria bacterium]|nr:bifunctional molybdopterin-guanine dinucleotide biosynthesis adaptor protein MobB/molybdopterin molybdotransferase MoeA [Alphaproteobacteria bacterium]
MERRFEPIFGITGPSGSGKTTLITKLVPELKRRGITVSTMKLSHHDIEVDKPGKDSHEHRAAGATEVMLAAKGRWTLFHDYATAEDGPDVRALAARMAPVDLILVEGRQPCPLGKLEVHRPDTGRELFCKADAEIVAVASDGLVNGLDLPVLDLNDVQAIADFVLKHVDEVRMNKLSDDCFDAAGQRMPIGEALELLKARLSCAVGKEEVPLNAASGRILAEAIVAPCDVPPHDNAAVDGYAVFFDDLESAGDTRLPVGGRVSAGHPLERFAKRGEALRIFTGAPVPEGPDTIFMQEDCTEEGDTVRLPAGIRQGANFRKRGEDLRQGERVLDQGRRLRPPDIGLAASVGCVALPVFQPLRVAVFSTGDEVTEPGRALPDGAIYDANRYMLMGLLEGLGAKVTDLGILPDDLHTVEHALNEAARNHDLLFTSGGVSVGEEDHVRKAVSRLGSLHLWQLAIKPGRPVALGRVGQIPFIGLPGNPVAVAVTFLRFARVAVLRLAGATVTEPVRYRVKAGFAMTKKGGRLEWVRCRLRRDEEGALVAERFPREGSGILASIVGTDGLAELPEDLTRVEKGMAVDFLPYVELMP